MLSIIFQNFKLIFWIISSFFCLFVIFKYKKNYSEVFNSWNLFILALLYTLYWIPQGFDITDEGFTLSKSWFMLHGMWEENINATWGSTLINGIWLKLLGTPSIFWARVGYSLLIASVASINFIILIEFFKKRESFFITLLIVIIGTILVPQTINYQNLPTIVILLSFLYMTKAIKKKKENYFIISGFFISISILVRFTNIIIIVIPIIYSLLRYFYITNDIKEFKKIILKSYLGVVIGILLGIIILVFTKSLNIYYTNIIELLINSNQFNTTHTYSSLIQINLNDLWLILSKSFFIGILLFVIPIIVNKDKKSFFKIITVITISWFMFFSMEFYGDSQNWKYLILSFSITGLIIFISLSKSIYEKYEVIFFGLVFFFLSHIGSDSGFRLLFFSQALVLPMSVFILLLKDTTFKLNNKPYTFRIPVYSFLIFLILVIITKKADDVYRERPRNELNTYFKSEALKGIKSNDRRVNTVDSLINFVENNFDKKKSMLVVGQMPMIYFMLDRKYIVKNLWRSNYDNSDKEPDYIIFSKKNIRDVSWPINSYPLSSIDSTIYKYYKNFCIENQYIKLYENEMFEIYSTLESIYNIDEGNLIIDDLFQCFNNGIACDWNRHRDNSVFSKDSINFYSLPTSQKIIFHNKDSETGITRDILNVDEMYYIEAWVYSNKKTEIVIQAGGGLSSKKIVIEKGKWIKIKAFLNASGTTLYFYSTLEEKDCINIDNVKLIKLGSLPNNINIID